MRQSHIDAMSPVRMMKAVRKNTEKEKKAKKKQQKQEEKEEKEKQQQQKAKAKKTKEKKQTKRWQKENDTKEKEEESKWFHFTSICPPETCGNNSHCPEHLSNLHVNIFAM